MKRYFYFSVVLLLSTVVLSGCRPAVNTVSIGKGYFADGTITGGVLYESGSGDFLLLTTLTEGKITLVVLDAGQPFSMEAVAELDLPLPPLPVSHSLYCSGPYLIIPYDDGSRSCLWLGDIGDPRSPVEIDVVELDDFRYAGNITAADGLAAVGSFFNRGEFILLDISAPLSPRQIGGTNFLSDRSLSGIQTRLVLDGGSLYILNAGFVKQLDITNPEAPLETGHFINTDWDETAPGVANGSATGIFGIATYSFETYEKEKALDMVYPAQAFFDFDLHSGFVLTAAGNHGLAISAIGDQPDTPIRIGLPGRSYRVKVSGDFTFVLGADFKEGDFVHSLSVIDIDDPLAPSVKPVKPVFIDVPGYQEILVTENHVFILSNRSVYVIVKTGILQNPN